MDVWTEADATGFRYVIVSEDGSESIRIEGLSRVARDRTQDVGGGRAGSGGADAGELRVRRSRRAGRRARRG